MASVPFAHGYIGGAEVIVVFRLYRTAHLWCKTLRCHACGSRGAGDAEVVNVEGGRVDFKVSASDGNEEIGSGTHQRIVIDLRSFNERLAKKSR
jgi:predicted thioesterase